MSDLFKSSSASKKENSYSAEDIEVLEGLEPVRKRPGMYIGGTDERAYHHLASEILDNAMDEAVAGYASKIEMSLNEDGSLTISDNGRGIPVDKHPKYPQKSALEVILTTLHSGGKFSGKAYQTSGGLHGVGISVVNALSSEMWVEVAREQKRYKQSFSRGLPTSKLENLGKVSNRRGTTVSFCPDKDIFGSKIKFSPARLYKMARSKAYLFRGVKIKWSCDSALIKGSDETPTEETIHFPDGLLDFLNTTLSERTQITASPFHGVVDFPDDSGRAEFAVAWTEEDGLDGFTQSYCNTIPTAQGGTHEQGLRNALMRGLKAYGEMTGVKKASDITGDDVVGQASILLSVFIKDPQFQGQTKDRLSTPDVVKWVESSVRDHFDHWLSGDPASSTKLLTQIIQRADERKRRRESKNALRKSATRRLRLPGKLADCSQKNAENTEIFLVEGDSAGGSAKQGRNRETQAILPLRGKILNVVSASADKIRANQEVQDMIQALGCGTGNDCDLSNLRYERVIIMTDADVDGAHIAALLITFFYSQMRPLIDEGHLYLAQPPLYRLVSGTLSEYARDDAHKDELMKTVFKGKKKVEVSRFKGLGEMPAAQLKETTMKPSSRTLLRVKLPQDNALMSDGETTKDVNDLVDRLMGKNAEARFQFIQDNAEFVQDIDI